MHPLPAPLSSARTQHLKEGEKTRWARILSPACHSTDTEAPHSPHRPAHRLAEQPFLVVSKHPSAWERAHSEKRRPGPHRKWLLHCCCHHEKHIQLPSRQVSVTSFPEV